MNGGTEANIGETICLKILKTLGDRNYEKVNRIILAIALALGSLAGCTSNIQRVCRSYSNQQRKQIKLSAKCC